jgi:hypothetical protein
MSGGLIQLAAYGQQDIYISGNPQITFFKVIYRRHTNFSIEAIEQTFSTEADFGKIVAATIARGNGDLIHKIYFQFTLPALQQPAGAEDWLGYVNSIGHNIIKRVDLEIGGQLIERHYSEWLEIWSELTMTESERKNYNPLIGKYNSDFSLETNALEERTYQVPLQFWFCRNQGLALPIIALTQHEVKIKMEFRPITELIKSNLIITDPRDVNGAVPHIKNASLYVDYVFLDDDERKIFAQAPHEYLIELVQYQGEKPIESGVLNDKIRFSFDHPVKELAWVIQTNMNLRTNSVTGNNHLKFEAKYGGDTFKSLRIQFNGGDRFSPRNAQYFRSAQALDHHSGSSRKHIYTYSFALKPEEHQPSGSVNMSRVNNSDFFISFNPLPGVDLPAPGEEDPDPDRVFISQFKLFALSYNVIRIVSGTAGMAF